MIEHTRVLSTGVDTIFDPLRKTSKNRGDKPRFEVSTGVNSQNVDEMRDGLPGARPSFRQHGTFRGEINHVRQMCYALELNFLREVR